MTNDHLDMCTTDGSLNIGTGAGGLHAAGADFNGIQFTNFYQTGGMGAAHIALWGDSYGFSVMPGVLAHHSDQHHKFFLNAGSTYEGDIVACISKSASAGFTGIYSNYEIVACSDCRGKSNIATIENALQKVDSLQGRTYITAGSNGKTYGLVAQEVAPVIPELVYSGVSGEQYGLKYQNMAALFVESIKELSKENKELKSRIEKLEK
jgi:hypothetical protein